MAVPYLAVIQPGGTSGSTHPDLLDAFLEAYRLGERTGRPKVPLTCGGSGVRGGSRI
jgi:hypothetical protein